MLFKGNVPPAELTGNELRENACMVIVLGELFMSSDKTKFVPARLRTALFAVFIVVRGPSGFFFRVLFRVLFWSLF